MMTLRKRKNRRRMAGAVKVGRVVGGWLDFDCELIARSGAIFPRGFLGGLALPPQHARRHRKPGTAAALATDLLTVGSQHRQPLPRTIAAGAGNRRERLAGGFALFNIELINPPLVPRADLREVTDAWRLCWHDYYGQLAVSPAVQHLRTIESLLMK